MSFFIRASLTDPLRPAFGRIVGSLLLVCLLSHTAATQIPDYHLQVFDYSYGIRAGNILDISKDRNGFFWILYYRSVQRFDGRQVKNFPAKEFLNRLFCDDHGGVWTSSEKKVYRFIDDSRGFREVPIRYRDTLRYAGPVFQMPDRSVWLFCPSGFYRFDPREQQFLPVLPDFPLEAPYSTRTFAVHGHTVFLIKNNVIYACNTLEKKLRAMPNRDIYRIFPLDEQTALVSTWGNQSFWYQFRDSSISSLVAQDLPGSNFTTHGFGQIDSGRFLVVGREGIFEWTKAGHRLRRLRLFANGRPVFANDFANHLHIDPEGYAWLATINGIARFSLSEKGMGMLRINPPDNALQASVNNVRRMVEDGKGNLWFATGNGLACWKINEGKWDFVPPAPNAPDRLAYPSLRGLVFDGKYLIIGPANLGVWLFDPLTRRFRRPAYPKGEAGEKVKKRIEQDFIDEITTLQNGNHLIMGRDALYVLDGTTYVLNQVNIPPGRENTNFAFQAPEGPIWLVTGRGLYCLDSSLQVLAGMATPVREQVLTSGFVLPNGELLYACFKGLFKAQYHDGKIIATKLTGEFDNQLINIVYQDQNNAIWGAGDAGVFRFEPETRRVTLLDHSDNVQGFGFNPDAWYRDRAGRVFFGGTYGINYVIPESFRAGDRPLFVFFQKIKVNENDTLAYSFNEPLRLNAGQKSIEIEFAAPYFNNPDKIKFRYMLEGFDAEWKSLGNNNRLRLTSLPGGDYRLRLQASVNGMDWVEATSVFAFSVDAPFWQKSWFYLLGLLLTSGTVYWFVRSRNQKFREKQEELEAEQAINYFATSMYERATVDEILWDVARNCIGRLHFEDCVIYLIDEQRQMLVQKAAHGPKSPRQFEIAAPIEIPVGKGIVGSVAANGQPELIGDTRPDPRYIVDDRPRLSEIAVPIRSDGGVLGVIDCEHSKAGFFTAKHLSILTTIASLCANKITRARAEAEKEAAKQVLDDTRQKMREVEMQALRAQMNPHFIFNCLNSINRYIVKSDQATASLYLTRFAKLIRLILDNSNNKNVVLSNELEALRLYIEMESLRFSQKFTYDIIVENNVNPDSIEVPPLIIQPFVENAIWHGLLHKTEAGRLRIHLQMAGENMLQCTVEDNGIGRQKARDLKSKSATTRKSLGMQLTEDRLSLLNKHAQLNSSIEIIDLAGPEQEAAGTRVILNILV